MHWLKNLVCCANWLIDYITKVGQIVGGEKKTVLTKGLQKDRQSIDNTASTAYTAQKSTFYSPKDLI
jgi:hypothetical protein